MRNHRVAAALAVLAGAAIVGAPPARAGDFGGTYLKTSPTDRSTWVVTSCGAGCRRVADSTGWSADARLVRDHWTFEVSRPDATTCLYGERVPGTTVYSVAPSRDNGTMAVTDTGPCHELRPALSVPVYFTLTKLA